MGESRAVEQNGEGTAQTFMALPERSQDGSEPVEGNVVVTETLSGSHEAEEARWRDLTDAEPMVP